MSAEVYAVSARITREHRSADGITDVHTYVVDLPTFYLFADVQGIVDRVHAESIAREIFERSGIEPENINLCVVETSAQTHASAYGVTAR